MNRSGMGNDWANGSLYCMRDPSRESSDRVFRSNLHIQFRVCRRAKNALCLFEFSLLWGYMSCTDVAVVLGGDY